MLGFYSPSPVQSAECFTPHPAVAMVSSAGVMCEVQSGVRCNIATFCDNQFELLSTALITSPLLTRCLRNCCISITIQLELLTQLFIYGPNK